MGRALLVLGSDKIKTMLYVYYGNNRVRALLQAEKVLEKCGAEEVVHLDDTTATLSEIFGLAEQEGLFGGTKAVRGDQLLGSDELGKDLLKQLNVLSSSKTVFVLLEDKILAEPLRAIKKVTTEVEEYKLAETKSAFNTFALADALLMRDKKALWVLLMRAFKAEKTAEEIIGTLFWQMKSFLIVENGGGTSLSPFVVGKVKRQLKNFKTGEMKELTNKLLTAYHEARRGRGDMETALERFVLGV